METELMGACQTDFCFAWRAFWQDAAHAGQVFEFYFWRVAYPLLMAGALYLVALKRGWLRHAWGEAVVLPAALRFMKGLRVTGRHMRRIYNREQAAARRRRGGE